MKIQILIPYFGICPPWLPYFLQTCRANPEINWLLYSDLSLPQYIPENVHIISASIEDFNRLASDKLQLKISIRYPYKICDLRPSFGKIFEDYLKDFDFWGYSDLDLFYGKINHFITDDLLNNFDIISVRKSYLAGHLAFYRNNEKVNNLFKRGYRYKKIFQYSERHFTFDEKIDFIGKPFTGVSPDRKIISGLKTNILRINYRILNWVPVCPTDMTEITKRAAIRKHIKYFAEDMVRSDLWFSKRHISEWEISWKNGKLYDRNNHKEILHFHIINSKGNENFKVDTWSDNPVFYITRHGISKDVNHEKNIY